MKTFIDVCKEYCTVEEQTQIIEAFNEVLPGVPIIVHDERTTIKVMEQPADESRLAKYWASEEMAFYILCENPELVCFDDVLDYLSRLLKKEWFR